MARVLVLCGGDNYERRVSLNSADAVTRGLVEAGHEAVKVDTGHPDVVAGPDQLFFKGESGPATDAEIADAHLSSGGWQTLIQTIINVAPDVVFPILHGGWGEGGHIQAVLELLGFPYLGSEPFPSGLAMNKWMARGVAYHLGIPIPYGFMVRRGEDPDAAFSRLESGDCDLPGACEFPVVVKPNCAGSTVGLVITDKREEFIKAVKQAHQWGDDALVEQYISGQELTVSVINGEAMPVIEIRPKTAFYDYTRKYTHGATEYLCPAPIPEEVALPASEMSEMFFAGLGCRHLARVDWRLREDGALFLLELNTIPGMTDLSLVPMAAKAAGMDMPALMNRFVEMSLKTS